MSKRSIILISVVAVAVIAFVWMFASGSGKEEEKEIVPANWNVSYKYDSRDPYGGYMMYEMLKKYTVNFRNVEGNPYDFLRQNTSDAKNLLLVVYAKSYADYEFMWDKIDDFIDAGNKALFILDEDPENLLEYYQGVFKVNAYSADSSVIHFTDGPKSNFTYKKLNDFKTEKHIWKYFALEETVELDKDIESGHPAGYVAYGYDYDFYFTVHEENNKGKPVFIEIPYGDGAIFIHRNPMAFTNYALLSEKNVDHLEMIMNIVDCDGIIYNTHEIAKELPKEQTPRISPIQFILSKPSLRWAYFLALAGLALFMLFNLKRKQKPLQVLPPKENTTLEFADALSKIYYQKHNNKNILKHKYRIFTTFIRTHYHIVPGSNKEEFVRLISVKSGVERKTVQGLMDTMDKYLKLDKLSDEQLISIHKLVTDFYKHCK